MSNEIPICACDEVYRNGAHHPECPVLREIETLQQRVAELEAELAHRKDKLRGTWCDVDALEVRR